MTHLFIISEEGQTKVFWLKVYISESELLLLLLPLKVKQKNYLGIYVYKYKIYNIFK